eukprot:1152718-Pelagomonas_calceolata.AAC.1
MVATSESSRGGSGSSDHAGRLLVILGGTHALGLCCTSAGCLLVSLSHTPAGRLLVSLGSTHGVRLGHTPAGRLPVRLCPCCCYWHGCASVRSRGTEVGAAFAAAATGVRLQGCTAAAPPLSVALAGWVALAAAAAAGVRLVRDAAPLHDPAAPWAGVMAWVARALTPARAAAGVHRAGVAPPRRLRFASGAAPPSSSSSSTSSSLRSSAPHWAAWPWGVRKGRGILAKV